MADCRSKWPCRHCGASKSHHHSLCSKMYGGSVQNVPELNVHAKEFVPVGSYVSATGVKQERKRPNIDRGVTVLGTAMAVIRGTKGTARVRVLVDNGSSRSLGRLEILQRIGAQHVGDEALGIAGVMAESRTYDEYGCYKIIVSCVDGDEVPVYVNGIKCITTPVEKRPLKVEDYPILEKFDLADPGEDDGKDVQLDILIGLDQFYLFVRTIEVRLSDRLVLLKTKLGYIANGTDTKQTRHGRVEHVTEMLAIDREHPDDRLNRELETLWRLESVGVNDPPKSSEDEAAESQFEASIAFDDKSKRYLTGWPWKFKRPPLKNNLGIAKGRLSSLFRQLEGGLLERYDAIIQDQKEKGVVEEVPPGASANTVHYIPHHCIVRPDKATTKIRVVYDASAKASKEDLSLNECMYRGPVLLADLCGLILRFREHPIGLVSDLEKAFLQVGLHPADRDVARFLWVKDISKPPAGNNLVKFRFTRVLFGVIASPYMLAGAIKHHMVSLGTPIAHEILRSCYVDNVITGVESHDEAVSFYREAKQAFATASMNLREWHSNDKAFMNAIALQDRGEGKSTTVLGLHWSIEADTLQCHSKQSSGGSCTSKREMLQAIARLFDPCGFLSPVTIIGKIIMQSLWKLKIDWSSPVPTEIQTRWNKFAPDLDDCREIRVSRLVSQSGERVQLHCFCDASKDAYSAVVYRRSESRQGVKCALVFAKVKVSPLKDQTLTIPKLELMALTLGSQVVEFVHGQLNKPAVERFLWSDSQCSIHWISRNAQEPVFVRNRVKKIKSVPSLKLRYVPTDQNPADIPTRGMTSERLRNESLWWNGPQFLTKASNEWPVQPEGAAQGSDTQCAVVTVEVQSPPFEIEKYSNLVRLLRITAWVLRFASNLRTDPRNRLNSDLSSDELERALILWIRITQSKDAAEQGGHFQNLQKQLKLFVDPTGMLRLLGRLDNANIPYDMCFPIYLPAGAHLTKLIILSRHEAQAHAGVPQCLADLRTRFWVTSGRSTIRGVLRSCRVCRRWKGGMFPTPDPPPLPEIRLADQPSFSFTGLDYLGPLVVRSSAGNYKVWIALFTCCSTRAVHLEVVTDMTAEQCLLCLRRFFAICGVPQLLISDNAKQFRLSDSVNSDLWSQAVSNPDVQGFIARQGVTWKYIVEFAPWMGGFYERMVGIAKKGLKCAIQNQLLTLVELQTVVAEITSIVNSRPLTYCENEIGNAPLTPQHLVHKRRNQFPLVTMSLEEKDPDFRGESKATLVRKWKRISNRIASFWDTWLKDYVVALREREWKPCNRGSTWLLPKVGGVVLVREEMLPRGQWRIAKIVGLIESADGSIRSARLQTTTGHIIQRPLKLLCPLEVPDEPSHGAATPDSKGTPDVWSPETESQDSVRQSTSSAIQDAEPKARQPTDQHPRSSHHAGSKRPQRKAAEQARTRWQPIDAEDDE